MPTGPRQPPGLYLQRLRWPLIAGLVLLSTYWSLSLNYDRLDYMLWQESDPLGYYQFLPALQGRHSLLKLPWAHPIGAEHTLSVFQIGTALLQAPFYFLGELLIRIMGMEDNGYGRMHAMTQALAASTYGILGLVFAFDALVRLVRRWIAWLTVIGLGLATNLFFYVLIDTGMSHVYSFFLIAWLVRLTVRARGALTPWRLYGLLVCCALVPLIRVMNGWALIFPLLYGVISVPGLRARALGFKRYPVALGLGLLTGAAVWAPQLAYWHAIMGRWYVNGYREKGERFNWGDAHLLDILFSHQNGWFIYTPLMLFAVAALFVMAWRNITGGRVILAVVAMTWVVYAAWWCWWLAGGFGHRGFVDDYALLGIPLAWGIERFVAWARHTGMVLSIALVGFFAYINVNMTYLYQWPWERESWTWDKLYQVWEHALAGDRQRYFRPK